MAKNDTKKKGAAKDAAAGEDPKKAELVAKLEELGCNVLTGNETVKDLEKALKDAKANGIRRIVTEEDKKDNPELAAAVGEEIRIPFPEEKPPAKDEKAEKAKQDQEAQAAKDAAAAAKKQEEEDAAEVEVKVTGNVRHDGVDYKAGDTVTCTGLQAKRLRAAGVAE